MIHSLNYKGHITKSFRFMMTSEFPERKKKKMLFICISKESILRVIIKLPATSKRSFPIYKQTKWKFLLPGTLSTCYRWPASLQWLLRTAPYGTISVFRRWFCLERNNHIYDTNTHIHRVEDMNPTHTESRLNTSPYTYQVHVYAIVITVYK